MQIFEMLLVILLIAVAIVILNTITLTDIGRVFDPKFYIAQPVTIRSYTTVRSDVTDSIILPAAKAYVDAPAEYRWVDTETPLDDMNEGNLDLAIVRRVGNVASRPNVGFVGNLMNSTMMIMSPNQYNIYDLADLAKVNNVQIKVNNVASMQVMKDILKMYPDITNVTVTENATIAPAVYAFLVVHPSPEISILVKAEPMHVVTMNKLNKGDYFVAGETEQKFYKENLFYEKASFDMHRNAVKYYPGLSMRGKLLYYPTIQYKYALFANMKFSSDAVKRILLNLMSKRIMSETEVAYDPDRLVNTHPGAREVYLSKRIYTDEPRPPIWQGF
jgi:hypothetical protein